MRRITFGRPGSWIAAFDMGGRAVTLDAAARAAGQAEVGLTNRRLLAWDRPRWPNSHPPLRP